MSDGLPIDRARVCLLTSAHPPFDVRIFQKEARTLADAGYDVTLCAQHPRDEVVDGVRILGLRRPSSRLARMTLTTWSAFFRGWRVGASIYHFHDPELLPVGLALKALRKKVVYDVHEDYRGGLLHAYYLPKWSRPIVAVLVDSFEKSAVRAFDAVVAATEHIAGRFAGVADPVVVRNFPLRSQLIAPATDVAPSADHGAPFDLVYAGIISPERGIANVVRALGLASHPVRLILCGPFSPESFVHELRETPGFERVDYRGVVDFAKVTGLLSASDAGVVCFLDLPNHAEAMPNKLFEYMAAELPVIASDFPLWRRLVGDCGAGLIVDPSDPMAIARAIDRLIEHPAEAREMGKRGRKSVAEGLNWETESLKLLRLYDRLAAED